MARACANLVQCSANSATKAKSESLAPNSVFNNVGNAAKVMLIFIKYLVFSDDYMKSSLYMKFLSVRTLHSNNREFPSSYTV